MTIRTYKPRRGRVSAKQAAALVIDDGLLITLPDSTDRTITESTIETLDLGRLFGSRPVVLEIGFGTGAATAATARAEPDVGILAVEVHTAGLGDLLLRIRADSLSNVRVVDGDALVLIRTMIPDESLDGIRSYFPDPWQKARHHKRRLVTVDNAEILGSRTRAGGFWHLATDWAPYAEHILEVMSLSPHWDGGIIERPDSRPVTRYESTALGAHRDIFDLWFTRR